MSCYSRSSDSDRWLTEFDICERSLDTRPRLSSSLLAAFTSLMQCLDQGAFSVDRLENPFEDKENQIE